MSSMTLKRPGGPMATRQLHFIWLADCSGSMSENGKIQALNHAIRETLPHMVKAASESHNATVLVRAIRFADHADWHVSTPTPVEQFRWTDMSAGGLTHMGDALRLVADELGRLTNRERMLPPVLVLVSDGQPTDDFAGGLRALMSQELGRKAVRIAIAIGADADRERLQEFIGSTDRTVLQANNPETLVSYIRWASTAVLKSVSSPVSQATITSPLGAAAVPVPKPPATSPLTDGPVW
jgi:uncharacterized protein YegL